MRRFGLLISGVFLVVAGFANDEFGPLAEVRDKHPDFFKPGVVTRATHNKEDWYVYCGDAEKCLTSETEEELYEEAQVQAKLNFFNHFAKKDPGVKLEVVGARRMYQCADKELRLVVMGVPVKGVTVRHSASNVVVEDKSMPVPKTKVPVSDGQGRLNGGGKSLKVVSPSAKVDEPTPKVNGASPRVDEPAPKVNDASQDVARAATEVEGSAHNPQPSESNGVISSTKEDSTLKQPVRCEQEELSDEEKLDILRKRIEARPTDYRIRMRMAKVFVRQGRVRRAFNNYKEAARLLIEDPSVSNADRAADLMEIAQYEEFAKEYALAIKHYRMILKLGNRELVVKANSRISDLLIRFFL